MKKKFNYICLASLLALGTACQDDNLVTKENGGNMLTFSVSFASDEMAKAQTRSAVEFTDENGNPTPFDITLSVEDTYAEQSLTRGTPIKTEADFNKYIESFRAWGWYGTNNNNNKWEAINTSSTEGTKIMRYAGTDYRPTDGTNFILGYYPDDTKYNTPASYRFFAIAPFDMPGITLKSNPSNTSLSCTYTSPDDGDNDAVAQKEILLGYLKSGATKTNIPINFKPLLAAIQFKVSPDQLGRKVTINKIEICQFLSTGDFTFDNTGQVTWATGNTTKRRTPKNFVQEFNYSVTESEKGQNINDNDLTKTFFVIPQTGSTSTTNGTQVLVRYTDDNGVERVGKHLLYGQEFEAGKTYIYRIGNFKKESNKLEPWVDFSNFEVNNTKLLGTNNKIQEENNSKFIFDFAQDGAFYEKAYFKVYNLEKDHWYSIEFDEKLSLVGYNTTPFAGPGSYACTMSSDQNLGEGRDTQLIFYTDEENPPFIWEHPDDKYTATTYTSLKTRGETAKLTFQATGTEMWWNWDYSKGVDNRTLRAEIYMKGSKIKDITPVSGVPTVDFLGSTLHNFQHVWSNSAPYNMGWNGYSSFKTYAINATDDDIEHAATNGEFFFRIVNKDGYGKLNIPLTNLNTGHTYMITYKIDKVGTVGRATGNFGCSILDAKETSKSIFSNLDKDKDKDKNFTSLCSAADFSIDGTTSENSITFTASAGTMYWFWELSKFNTETSDHQFITFSKVTINDITP